MGPFYSMQEKTVSICLVFITETLTYPFFLRRCMKEKGRFLINY